MNETTRSNMNAIDAALQAASMSTSINLTSEQLDAAADAFYKVHQALEASAALIEAEPTSSDPTQQARIDKAVEALRKLEFDICEDCGKFQSQTLERSDYTDHPTLCRACHEQRTIELIEEQSEEPSDWEWEQEQSRDYWS